MDSAQHAAARALEPAAEELPLRLCVERAVGRYLHELGGFYAGDMHRLVIEEVERPLLERVLAHVGGNQTQAAEILGINRATLRKKLRHYQISG
jgi:Fis family transcriptional regulator